MSEIEQELRSFEAQINDVEVRVGACVEWLRSAQDDDLRYLVAERLPSLGSSALSSLQRIIDDPGASGPVRYFAAWVAIEIGDRGDSVDVLCAEIDAGTKWSLPAAGILARHRIHEGANAVAAALERADPRNEIEVLGYATALRDLGGGLSESLRRRILSESPPWVARALDEDFPIAKSE